MQTQKSSQGAAHAFKVLRSLYQVSTDLYASENRQDLIFRILNRTVELFPYRRAVLWSLSGTKPVLLGISGREEINRQSPFAKLWEPIVSRFRDAKNVQIVQDIPGDLEKEWRALAEKTSGLAVMWIPITLNGHPVAGLWLERWGQGVWDPAECELMTSYAQNLRLAWKQIGSPRRWYRIKTSRQKLISFVLATALIGYLAFIPAIPLRVVAPCEIVPKDPEMVAAPLDGVIKEITVKPGDLVKPGDPLFMYEDRIILQDLKVAQKQVEIIRSQYNRLQFKSFIDQDAMEEIQSLKYRLEQEEVRLKLAESKAEQLQIVAKVEGVCMVDHPEYWPGRPVQIGERVVMIFNPNQSKVKIFLPEKDNIEFNRDRPVAVILNAAPTKRIRANLYYVAPQTSQGPKGEAFFLAEALWPLEHPSIRVGSKGTAVIFGEKVSLVYWLLRKPIAGVRQLLGL